MFKSVVKESSKELSARERIMLKDTTGAIKLDEATQADDLEIVPVMWAILDIHNDKADDKDYENYVVVDKSGLRYVTGSTSFWKSFMDIYTEMENEGEEYTIKVYRVPSRNYKGKDFITCSII